jgi:hypothetical protein
MRDKPLPNVYLQKFPDQQILLYRGLAELISGKKVIKGKGIIRLTWHPYPSISVEFEYFLDGDEERESFSDYELKLIESVSTEFIFQEYLKVYSTGSIRWGKGQNKILGYLAEPFIKGNLNNLYSIVFHVTNFYRFTINNTFGCFEDEEGNEIETERESWLHFNSQLVFDYDSWHIVLSTLNEDVNLWEKLVENGGYGLTHICKIEKQNGSILNFGKAYNIIEAFTYYLSFARGLWVAPILVSGFNQDGYQVMEEWRYPIIQADRWNQGFSWLYDCFDNTMIVEIFPYFMQRWQDDMWQDVMRNCIQWLMEGLHYNRSENTSIILFQAALEKLSWTYIRSKDCLSGDGFKKLRVADQIRLLISFLNIPIITFDEYPYLEKKAKERNWKDSLQALTEVRNVIVHPEIKDTSSFLSIEILEETTSIAKNYLLHSLLEICSHDLQ